MTNPKGRRSFTPPPSYSAHPTSFADSPHERRIDAIARLAAEHFGLPMALITATVGTREYGLTCVNFEQVDTPWKQSFSAAAMELDGNLLFVPNAAADPRFAANPLVAREAGIVFCAGIQMTNHNGVALGALFVFDTKVRPELSSGSFAALATFARQAAFELECPRITAELRLFTACSNQADDAIFFAEHRGPTEEPAIVYTNASFERMTGYRLEDVQGKWPFRALFGPNCPNDTYAAIRGAIKMASPISFEAVNYRKDGSPFVADISFSPVFDERGTCTHWISVRRDVTAHRKAVQLAADTRARNEVQSAMERAVAERERAEHALKYLSFHDVLTGLPNRSLLLQQAAEDLGERRVSSMFFIDIDRFKSVNATFGREAADGVLADISSRITNTTPHSSVVARMEGDSFAVWIPGLDRAGATSTAGHLLAAISSPFFIEGQPLTIHASIGIASTDSQRYKRPEDLLTEADVAMYNAKHLGGNRFHTFTPDLHHSAATRLLVEMRMQQALEAREFVLHYQPIVRLDTGEITAFEALLRWNDPERGLVPPGLFIPIAEQTGQILPIGAHVLQRACSDAMQWRADIRGEAPIVNVNISGRQLGDDTLADCVLEALSRSGLPPSALCLEITESALVEHADVAIETLRRLRAHGVAAAMDDFGTGYSSLGYLRRFDFQKLKIDRSFISGLSGYDGIADPDIVQMVVSLAQTRGMYVTAEGIETKEQLMQAQALGCGTAQGYYLQHPMPLDAVLNQFGETASYSLQGKL